MERRTVPHTDRAPILVKRTKREDGGEDVKLHGLAAVYYDGTPRTEFDLWPGVKERIMRGTFARAIAEDDVRGLFNHEADNVLGRTKSGTMTLRDNPDGLDYEITPADTTLIESLRIQDTRTGRRRVKAR